MNSELLITLIFAAIAAFVIFKLRSVLGRRTGHEGSHETIQAREQGAASDNVVNLPDHRGDAQGRGADLPTAVAAGVEDIQRLDPAFDAVEFVGGARAAFQMIVEAYAAGDRETLKPLLAPEVYESFEAAISERERNGETLETHLERFRGVEIADAETQDNDARVTVLFVTEQINVTRDGDGKVVDGEPDAVETVSDLWTFARDTRSADPNWQLVETATPD